RAKRHGLAGLPAQGPLTAQRVNVPLNLAYAIADAAAVGFQFLFPRAAHADAALHAGLAAKPGKFTPLPCEPRKQIIQLRKLDLKLTLAALRMAREDIQNQLRSINYPAIRCRFHVALLHRSEIAVEYDQGGFT